MHRSYLFHPIPMEGGRFAVQEGWEGAMYVKHALPFIRRPEPQLHGEAPESHGRGKQGEVSTCRFREEPRCVVKPAYVGVPNSNAVRVHRLCLNYVGVRRLSAYLCVG